MASLAQTSEGPRFAFSLRAGVEARPGYFGSDELTAAPDFDFALGYLRLGPLSFGNPDLDATPEGFNVRGSLRFVRERTADDFDELRGLEDVDASFELGAGVAYTQSWWEAFADVRYGVVGHEGFVADLGFDFILRPSGRVELRAGPRVFLGDDEFASTYFAVTPAEAAASDFAAFDAEGGVLSAGLEANVAYRLTQAWGLEAGLRYDKLKQDAADSPITTEDEQLTAFVGVTRRFDIRF